MPHFQLPKLPYALDDLSPVISEQTLDLHYHQHHKTYVDKLNKLIKGTKFQDMSLEEIIKEADGPIFDNAGQAWNHTFYWNCMTPEEKSRDMPHGLQKHLEESFDTVEDFKKSFEEKAVANFGSGWTWLVKDESDQLKILNTSNARNPIIVDEDLVPLLVCDVWEHAYYVDYRYKRQDYVQRFFDVVNWRFVYERFLSDKTLDATKLMTVVDIQPQGDQPDLRLVEAI